MLHQDASRFAWLPGDDRQYDLVVTLDDATPVYLSAVFRPRFPSIY